MQNIGHSEVGNKSNYGIMHDSPPMLYLNFIFFALFSAAKL